MGNYDVGTNGVVNVCKEEKKRFSLIHKVANRVHVIFSNQAMPFKGGKIGQEKTKVQLIFM